MLFVRSSRSRLSVDSIVLAAFDIDTNYPSPFDLNNMPRPTSLSLTMPSPGSPISSAITSPASSEPPSASPQSNGEETYSLENKENQSGKPPKSFPALQIHLTEDVDGPVSPDLTSLPPFPSSPKVNFKHMRDPSKSFFANLKASKSSNRVNQMEPSVRQISEEASKDDSQSNSRPTIYTIRKGTGSTPDLSKSTFGLEASSFVSLAPSQTAERRPPDASTSSESIFGKHPTESLRKSKPRFGHLLNRTRSIRTDDGGRRQKVITPIRITGPEELRHFDGSNDAGGLKTAPLQQDKDRSFRDMMGSASRNKSADRQPATKNEHGTVSVGSIHREPVRGLTSAASAAVREGSGARAHLMTNLKNTSTRAADGLGKAGKGILGKITRGGSYGKEGIEEEPYVCSTINLPLIEQTRRTRIAKRLEDCKDKTEFWMPALPWRCIDYLNFKGCEEEGLYRIPGSGPRIREWQQRFDREGDIDLFNEHDLYDINIIGSMFKAWLRDLPTEIFPKETQAKIARECAGAKEVPELLKDELSRLPPWNYYLLFAITCHLSLLHAYVDKNRMNFANLCICFQPCLRIDSFCFQFLVRDWRNCWQGCWTEKEALEEEYRILDEISQPVESGSYRQPPPVEERGFRSVPSTKPKMVPRTEVRGRLPLLSLATTNDQDFTTPGSSPRRHHRGPSHLPELDPVKPLSPIGL